MIDDVKKQNQNYETGTNIYHIKLHKSKDKKQNNKGLYIYTSVKRANAKF